MPLSILIPCLNEEDTIEKVVQTAYHTAKKYHPQQFEIIVADNGSTDKTLEILSKLKLARVINVPVRGYGAALHWGILAAKYNNVIFADADMSYDFENLNLFIPHVGKYDLVLGSRIKGKIKKSAMPLLNRYLGTPVLTYLINVIYQTNSSDCNSGMRLIKKDFYQKLRMRNSGMEWASELLIKTALNNGSYKEVFINFSKDQRGHNPHLRRWEDGWRHLKVIILLKPSILYITALALLILAIFISSYSVFSAIALGLLSEFLLFSYFAAKKIESSININHNLISNLIDKLPLVFFAVIITTIGVLSLVLISDQHLFTKYILLFQIVIFDLWLFFIETIKTFLSKPLPESI
ncbi:MAG: glycosyltransferase family 2 protein [Patescibacteria group bacterium]|nr:glycosyltransferase family 2 protein [Patescibacteria group bacterium]